MSKLLKKKSRLVDTDQKKGGIIRGASIVDNGTVLQLATGATKAKLKHWKTLITNKTVSKQAKIKTGLMHLMMKNICGERIKSPMTFQA